MDINEILKNKDDPYKVRDWFDQWWELWPKGVESGGYPLRSSKSGALRKMIDFSKDHPLFTKAIIITATMNYLIKMKRVNYSYCKLAPYFIMKDGISMLEGYCEQVSEGIKEGREQDSSNKTQLGAKDF